MAEDEDYDQTLLIIKECFVYKIPPPTSVTSGYKAQDWDVSSFLWSGRLVVTAKGDRCTIRLEDNNTGEIFAVCPVDAHAVEPVTDSSRYFVLRIEDGRGRHAFIGMGFTERTEAFDFNVALQDHAKYVKQRREAKQAEHNLAQQPHVDFSLREGQTIHVNLKTKRPEGASAAPRRTAAPASGGGDFGLLAPPPRATQAKAAPSPSAPTQHAQKSDDFFGAFTSSTSSSSAGNNDWVAFQ